MAYKTENNHAVIFFYNNYLYVKHKYIQYIIGRREDIKVYFGEVITIFYKKINMDCIVDLRGVTWLNRQLRGNSSTNYKLELN